MPVCPLDYRYGTREMKAIFSNERRIDYLLRVEGALAIAQEQLGDIPLGTGDAINSKASTGSVSPHRVEELEEATKHDIMALIHALGEVVGEPASNYIHMGATSSDILDSATALQIRDANTILEKRFERFLKILSKLSIKTRDLLCIGRTHGQYAIPMTFGFKVGVWAMEFSRHMERFRQLRGRVEIGKMSGAVGTGAAFGKNSIELERRTMEILGIGFEEMATQVVQRDRYVEIVSFMANVATSLEKIATEIRNLQRSEIHEVREAFDNARQVGSSTMAQKVNPITSENVCGLSRLIRSMVIPAMENALMWHERDLANSSSERFIIPHSYILLDDALVKMAEVIENLGIDGNSMEEKVKINDLSMAEAAIMALVKKGIGRQEAHEMLRKITMRCRREKIGLRESLAGDGRMKILFTEDELAKIFDPRNYLGHIRKKIDIYMNE